MREILRKCTLAVCLVLYHRALSKSLLCLCSLITIRIPRGRYRFLELMAFLDNFTSTERRCVRSISITIRYFRQTHISYSDHVRLEEAFGPLQKVYKIPTSIWIFPLQVTPFQNIASHMTVGNFQTSTLARRERERICFRSG